MGAFYRFIHACSGRKVTSDSALLGLSVGALAGAVLTAGYFLAPILWDVAQGRAAEMAYEFWDTTLGIAAMFVIAALLWGIGLAVIGAPAWLILHKLKLRCWSAAMLLGAMLSPLGGLSLGFKVYASAQLAVAGAIVGLVVWLIAYRKGPDACAV